MFLFYATVIHFIAPPVRFSVFSSYIGLPGKKRFELIISACHFVVAFFQDTLYSGSISRDQVADVAVEALLCQESSYKVVEIIARPDAPNRPLQDMFAAIKQN